jgi:pSer/pThr/pTyr-binding forkhead associated (FHA) protein
MAKLVALNEGLEGQSFELKVEKSTIGRVEGNVFQISQGSVSSHHCEILLRGDEVVVKDLNSTNGTFVNGQQVAGGGEAVLKPGQTLRIGQVELRLDTGTGSAPAATPAASAPKGAPGKPLQSTMVISKGVSLDQLGQGTQGGLDTTRGVFTKKTNKSNLYFIVGVVVFVLVIVGLFIYLIGTLKGGSR